MCVFSVIIMFPIRLVQRPSAGLVREDMLCNLLLSLERGLERASYLVVKAAMAATRQSPALKRFMDNTKKISVPYYTAYRSVHVYQLSPSRRLSASARILSRCSLPSSAGSLPSKQVFFQLPHIHMHTSDPPINACKQQCRHPRHLSLWVGYSVAQAK